MDISEADLDYALPADKVSAQPHTKYKMVNSGLKNMLQEASMKRIEGNADFEKLMKRIDSYRKQKEEKFASLLETDFMAKRAELNAEEEEEKQIEEAQLPKEKVFDPTYYNKEVLNVTKDYVDALQTMNLARAG